MLVWTQCGEQCLARQQSSRIQSRQWTIIGFYKKRKFGTAYDDRITTVLGNNYGIVYTSKGLASIFAGPVAALASTKTGSWVLVFWAMIACDLLAALMALLWLKPVAAHTIARAEMMLVVQAKPRTGWER